MMNFRINIHHVLFFCFFSGALCTIRIFTKSEGETFSFGCSFDPHQGQRFFTKKDQQQENVLIKTDKVTAQNGRYSINYDTQIKLFYVSISQLHKSDSGRYRCGLGNSSFSKSYSEFEVRVKDEMCEEDTALTNPGITVCTEPEGGSITVRCSFSSAGFFNLFFCKNECKKQDVLIETKEFAGQRGRYRIDYEKNGVFHVTIANLSKSDSGLFRCGVDLPSSPNPCQTVEIRVTDAAATSQPISTVLPSASAVTSSGSCTPSTGFPEITTLLPISQSASPIKSFIIETPKEETKATGLMTPLLVCLSVLLVLLAVILLVLFKKNRRRISYDPNTTESIECATY